MNEGWDNGATTFDCQWKNMDIGARTKKLAFFYFKMSGGALEYYVHLS
jgi:hypothetical protein